jgi:hypothetical protein
MFLQLNICGHSIYVTSSLTRGWVHASVVILESESNWTRDHVLLSQIRNSPNLECQVPVFISPGKRMAQIHTQTMDLSSLESVELSLMLRRQSVGQSILE